MRTSTPWFFCCRHSAFGRFDRTTSTPTLVLVAALYLAIPPVYGQQNPFTQVLENINQGIVLPQSVPLVPRQDAGALAEIKAYRSAISLGSLDGHAGNGTVHLHRNRFDRRQEAPQRDPLDSRLAWVSGGRTEAEWHEQRTHDGGPGAILYADEHRKAMDARDAAAGVLAFPMLI